MLDGLGRAANHDDVAFLENRVRGRVAADDAVAPHGADRGLRAAATRSAMLLPTAQACGGSTTL